MKTCVGTEWCRFGTQDSTGLGVKLEQFLCGSWTPAKVKLGVSGCPRNCAEATVQGHRHHLRRVRLRHPFRRRGRPARARDRPARSRHDRRGGASNTSPRSCSSTANRAPISNASRIGSSASAWKKSAPQIMDDHDSRQSFARTLQEIAIRGAQGPVGRARRRPRTARVHAARGSRADPAGDCRSRPNERCS